MALLKARFPRLPGYVRDEVLARLAGRDGIGAAKPLDSMVEAVARHHFTDYDRLRTRHGLTPEEARIAVADEVSALLDDWRGTLKG